MKPLQGITVVTLEHAIAAPFATRQWADLGARVIKIERPGSGDLQVSLAPPAAPGRCTTRSSYRRTAPGVPGRPLPSR